MPLTLIKFIFLSLIFIPLLKTINYLLLKQNKYRLNKYEDDFLYNTTKNTHHTFQEI